MLQFKICLCSFRQAIVVERAWPKVNLSEFTLSNTSALNKFTVKTWNWEKVSKPLMVEGGPVDYVVWLPVHVQIASQAFELDKTNGAEALPWKVSPTQGCRSLDNLIAIFLTCTSCPSHTKLSTTPKVSSAEELKSQEVQCVWWVLQSYWHWDPQHSWKGWTAIPILFAADKIELET